MGNFCCSSHGGGLESRIGVNPTDIIRAVAAQGPAVAMKSKSNFESFKESMERKSPAAFVVPQSMYGGKQDIELTHGKSDDKQVMHASLLCATGTEFRYGVKRDVWDQIYYGVMLKINELPSPARSPAQSAARTVSDKLCDQAVDRMVAKMASRIDANQGIQDVSKEMIQEEEENNKSNNNNNNNNLKSNLKEKQDSQEKEEEKKISEPVELVSAVKNEDGSGSKTTGVSAHPTPAAAPPTAVGAGTADAATSSSLVSASTVTAA